MGAGERAMKRRIGYITGESAKWREENIYLSNMVDALAIMEARKAEVDVAVARLWSEERTVRVLDD